MFSNCSEDSTELSEEEVEWFAKKQIRLMNDSIRKEATADCTENYSKYLQEKVDSLIVDYLKTADTTSLSKAIE